MGTRQVLVAGNRAHGYFSGKSIANSKKNVYHHFLELQVAFLRTQDGNSRKGTDMMRHGKNTVKNIFHIDRETGKIRFGKLYIGRRDLLTIVIAAFVLMFVYNVFHRNSEADVKDSTIRENLKFISGYDFSNVASVEKRIAQTGGTMQTVKKSNDFSKTNYKKIFDGCVAIGDSITEGLSSYGFLSEEQVFSKVGASLMKDGSMVRNAAKTFPKAAFFTFGMNDIGNYRGNATAFIKKYRETIADFSSKSPHTKLFVNSISVPSNPAREKNRSLNQYKKFNSSIRQMCRSMHITFIENNYILEEHPEYYGNDGIHVKPAYYKLWLDNMILKAGL